MKKHKKDKPRRNLKPDRKIDSKESTILKKYAAPRSKNFLYFDKLQEDFYLMVNEK